MKRIALIAILSLIPMGSVFAQDEEVDALVNKIAALTKEVDLWRNRVDALETQAIQQKEEMAVLRKKLAISKAQNEELRKQLAARKEEKGEEPLRAKKEKGVLERGLKALKSRLESVKEEEKKGRGWTSDLMFLLETASLHLLLAEQYKDPAPPLIRGSIAFVGTTENRVVINVGKDSGVKVGQKITIHRGETYVGKLQVKEIREEWTACTCILEETLDRLRMGDQVIAKVHTKEKGK
ncbi:MAG: hypothetical protein ACYTHN_07585 [Planctomycetota bacterium]|jgi:cell shape-determining protein MreC